MTQNYNVQSFQFHKGTIRTVMLCLILRLLVHFNSIKVRLEHYDWKKWSDAVNAFQFHKGTIRTYYNAIYCCLNCIFQFHKGTIRTN